MYCTRCGMELKQIDRFCSGCGARVGGGAMETVRVHASDSVPGLMLDKRNKKIAGVCAGFARYFGMDTVLMRVIWLVIALGTGVGFLVYLGAWIALPSDAGYQPYQSVDFPPPMAPERR